MRSSPRPLGALGAMARGRAPGPRPPPDGGLPSIALDLLTSLDFGSPSVALDFLGFDPALSYSYWLDFGFWLSAARPSAGFDSDSA